MLNSEYLIQKRSLVQVFNIPHTDGDRLCTDAILDVIDSLDGITVLSQTCDAINRVSRHSDHTSFLQAAHSCFQCCLKNWNQKHFQIISFQIKGGVLNSTTVSIYDNILTVKCFFFYG